MEQSINESLPLKGRANDLIGLELRQSSTANNHHLMTITFETKVWENDWELVLKTSRLEDLVRRCNHQFNNRILYINNVKNPLEVEGYAQRLIDKGVIDQFVHVHEHADAALAFFNLSKEKIGKGYYYSIAELVSIYLTETTYLLHFSSDTIPEKNIPSNWLDQGIQVLEENSQVKVFNLTWDKKYKEAQSESFDQNPNSYLGYGFSDQMYLVRTSDFRAAIYEEINAASERYPSYGGELFEKRVDSWMRNHQFLRATYKHGSYLHQNFTKNLLAKKIAIAINYPTFLSK